MRAINRWTVDVMIGECDGRTYAEGTGLVEALTSVGGTEHALLVSVS